MAIVLATNRTHSRSGRCEKGWELAMECILVVDDDPEVRSVIRAMLEQAKYDVLEAGSPLEALRVAEERSSSIDLLLADVMMPGISGSALAERIRLLQPRVKVLLMSAMAQKNLIAEGLLNPESKFISKPFTAPDLRVKIREVLDQRSPFTRLRPS